MYLCITECSSAVPVSGRFVNVSISAIVSPGGRALLDMPNPHGYTLGERMLRAKGARRAVLITEERQHKARWFYLSFATGYEFLGAACP